MESIFASTYEPLPAIYRRPSVESISRSSSFSSTSSSPRSASPMEERRSDAEARMDEALIKETMGLPIFLSGQASPVARTSHKSGNPKILSTPVNSSSNSSASDNTTSRSSPTPGKNFSSFLSVARTSLDTLVRKSATFLLEEADDAALVIEWRWESASAARNRRNSVGNALLDKDGWVEGWLD
ncbi:hypothetical protein ANO11243_090010 [Dothideomycetidae sp. 11243]|nr:hypothetical protein ANO11243_090010 [fungal sp. No.11243]